MRTFAARQNDTAAARYEDDGETLDPTQPNDAKRMLSTRGGAKAAKIALAELWAQANEAGQGYLPTARLSAPLRVLTALETIGVIERADDDRGNAIRFRLSSYGLDMALQAEKGAKA
jgi:hypothetical protein